MARGDRQLNNSNLKDWALFYADKGLKIFPVKQNGKAPITKDGYKSASGDKEQIEKWWNQYPNANIGLATGENGLYVVDVDKKKDSDGFKSLKENNIKLSETLKQYTPNGGVHHIYKNTGDYGCKVGLLSGVDIRAKGGYIVIAPSIVNGRKYEWADVNEVTDFNSFVKPYNDELESLYFDLEILEVDSFILPLEIGEGERNDILFKYASSMQAKKYTDSQIQDELIKVNSERCIPPLSDKELNTIIKSVLRYEKGNSSNYYEYPDGSKIDLSQFHRFRSDGKGGFTNVPIGVLVDVLAQYIITSYNFKVINGKCL